MDKKLQKEASRIADAIVAYVERADRDVTLCEIEREIPGFAKPEQPAWICKTEHLSRQVVLWVDMTEAGAEALWNVISGCRLTVQYVSLIRYLLEGDAISHENWQPIVLLPARAANLATSNLLLRTACAKRACQAQPAYQLLTPRPVSASADWCSL